MHEIEKLSKSKISKYSLLRHKKNRDREGLFIVQGLKSVNDSKSFFEPEAFIVGQRSAIDRCNYRPLYEASESEMKKISTLEDVPDIIGVFKIPVSNSENLKVRKGEFSLVLDGVQDPGNFGTIVRTAHWFGIKRIFCSVDTVDLYNPKVVQATMGSIAKTDVVYCRLEELFENNRGVPVYGLLLEGLDIFSYGEPAPGFIVMGSEGQGLRASTRSRITEGLTIPPRDPANHPESLNVAIATAITLSQLIK